MQQSIRVNFRLCEDIAQAYEFVSTDETRSMLFVGEDLNDAKNKAANAAMEFYRRAGAVVRKCEFSNK